jgi:L,D-peptidoglycan transpeptidase YkuD (ErfK/YbiS/YcfS/YnhG family)
VTARTIPARALAATAALGLSALAAAGPAQGADKVAAAPVTYRRPALPVPALMAGTGGGTQLITAVAGGLSATSGTLTWWEQAGGSWHVVGSAPVRFGARGLVEGTARKQGTNTTPTGLYGLPFAFGNAGAPSGTTLPYRKVTAASWWCEDVNSTSYNRWVSPLPRDCRASESEQLAHYPVQYAHAVVIDFNYARPVKGRGAGIFLHVNGSGATAGCVSVPADAMTRITAWLRPAAHPHIAIGTTSGDTALVGY